MQKEFHDLQEISVHKNEAHIINDTDKKFRAAILDKEVISACNRQLFDINTYAKLSLERLTSIHA